MTSQLATMIEATANDVEKKFTPKQWLEILTIREETVLSRHNRHRKGNKMTQNGRFGKEKELQRGNWP